MLQVTQDFSDENNLKVLLELYKVSIEEYRFQVKLNWDRNKFYVLLNSGLITANCGLLRIPGFDFAKFLTAPLFVLGSLAGWLGYKTLIKGIEYRRRAVIKKAEIENRLRKYSDILPIDTTAGMREAKTFKSIDDFDSYVSKPLRIGTISYFLATLFILLIVTNLVALTYLMFKNVLFIL